MLGRTPSHQDPLQLQSRIESRTVAKAKSSDVSQLVLPKKFLNDLGVHQHWCMYHLYIDWHILSIHRSHHLSCFNICTFFSNKGYMNDNHTVSDVDGKSDSTSGSRISILKNAFSKTTTVKSFTPEPEVHAGVWYLFTKISLVLLGKKCSCLSYNFHHIFISQYFRMKSSQTLNQKHRLSLMVIIKVSYHNLF